MAATLLNLRKKSLFKSKPSDFYQFKSTTLRDIKFVLRASVGFDWH